MGKEQLLVGNLKRQDFTMATKLRAQQELTQEFMPLTSSI